MLLRWLQTAAWQRACRHRGWYPSLLLLLHHLLVGLRLAGLVLGSGSARCCWLVPASCA
jgi:hypothetical protein